MRWALIGKLQAVCKCAGGVNALANPWPHFTAGASCTHIVASSPPQPASQSPDPPAACAARPPRTARACAAPAAAAGWPGTRAAASLPRCTCRAQLSACSCLHHHPSRCTRCVGCRKHRGLRRCRRAWAHRCLGCVPLCCHARAHLCKRHAHQQQRRSCARGPALWLCCHKRKSPFRGCSAHSRRLAWLPQSPPAARERQRCTRLDLVGSQGLLHQLGSPLLCRRSRRRCRWCRCLRCCCSHPGHSFGRAALQGALVVGSQLDCKGTRSSEVSQGSAADVLASTCTRAHAQARRAHAKPRPPPPAHGISSRTKQHNNGDVHSEGESKPQPHHLGPLHLGAAPLLQGVATLHAKLPVAPAAPFQEPLHGAADPWCPRWLLQLLRRRTRLHAPGRAPPAAMKTQECWSAAGLAARRPAPPEPGWAGRAAVDDAGWPSCSGLQQMTRNPHQGVAHCRSPASPDLAPRGATTLPRQPPSPQRGDHSPPAAERPPTRAAAQGRPQAAPAAAMGPQARGPPPSARTGRLQRATRPPQVLASNPAAPLRKTRPPAPARPRGRAARFCVQTRRLWRAWRTGSGQTMCALRRASLYAQCAVSRTWGQGRLPAC